jgi:hypothetical protein
MAKVDKWDKIDKLLRSDFRKVVPIAKKFLDVELAVLTGGVQQTFYSKPKGSKSKKGVSARSGAARRGWKWKVEGSRDQVKGKVFNDSPHADFGKEKTIRPKSSKYLAIPVGGALTKAGAPRFNSPRDLEGRLSLIKGKKADTFLMIEKRRGKRGQNLKIREQDIYFVLKKQVTVPAYTKLLGAFAKRESLKIGKKFGKHLMDRI